MKKRMKSFNNAGIQNGSLRAIQARLGSVDLPKYSPSVVDGVNDINTELYQRGGFAQQRRMIADKKRAFDKATVYSYQGALVRKWLPPHLDLEPPETDVIVPIEAGELLLPPCRALINPNKLTMDYDNKILSIGYEHKFTTGDIFKWCQTNSYWIIYLQDLDELAYFRGDIRRCRYQIAWKDENGNKQLTYVAVRGPVETKIDYIQKHTISVDNPNLTLNIIMPLNDYTAHYFKRYSKFYLRSGADYNDLICWRVQAVDTISTPGILELTAMEYYSNEFEDDIKNGVVDGLIVEPIDPNGEEEESIDINGDTFTKPKLVNEFYVNNREQGKWSVSKNEKGLKPPVKLEEYRNEIGYPCVRATWTATYSGQFELIFTGEKTKYTKIIVVQSLF